MYKNKSVCVVIPAYNEASQIGKVIETMPDYVDHIVIVDDHSQDRTSEVVEHYQKSCSKIILIRHPSNQGCGGALATGYKWAKDNSIDIAVRMDGDGQMNPENLEHLIEPVASGVTDYAKGNRLVTGEAYRKIPKIRYFGNAFLSLFTKIASGYWHIADFQSGFTAMNKQVLHTINWDAMYKRYGQPNDLLIRLNVCDFRVKDIPIEPVYHVGEKSGIKIYKVIFTISWLLLNMFLWRLKEKYVIRDFHPLVFFYAFGGIFGISTLVLFIRLFYYWIINGRIPPINALAALFSFMSASMFTVFAMWFDMEYNKNLKS